MTAAELAPLLSEDLRSLYWRLEARRVLRAGTRPVNVAMSVGLALAAILGAYLFVLWYASAGVIEQHEDRIAGLEKWRAEQFGGPGEVAELSDDTDEFPACRRPSRWPS
jgi:hypothetical protein